MRSQWTRQDQQAAQLVLPLPLPRRRAANDDEPGFPSWDHPRRAFGAGTNVGCDDVLRMDEPKRVGLGLADLAKRTGPAKGYADHKRE
jgi:hypothetical protein